MASVQKFSSHVIDYAERLATMADAAEGKRRKSGVARWLLLPASGAAVYALVKSDAFGKQAKGALEGAKTRASDLPDDLVARVRQAVERGAEQSGNGSRSTRSTAKSRKTKASSSSS